MPVVVALIILFLVGTASAEIRKADCLVTAERASKDLEAAEAVLQRMLAVGYGPLIKEAQGDLRAAAESTARAQTAAIPVLQAYVERMSGLRSQLRACAR